MKKLNRLFLVFLLIISLLIVSKISYASSNSFQVRLIKLNGHTSYEIKGHEDGGWKSILEFPLEMNLLELVYAKEFKQLPIINLALTKNLEKGSGIMKDSDWLYAEKTGKALYSESDSIAEYFSYDIWLNTKDRELMKSDIAYNFMLGYKEQEMNFDIYGFNYPNTSQEELGKTLTYDVTYQIPYLGLNLSSSKELFQFKAGVVLSPMTFAEDIDDHILRYKESKGSTKGYSYGFNGQLRCFLGAGFSTTIGIDYNEIVTTGKQKQYFYDGENEGKSYTDIDDRISSQQLFYNLSVDYRF